MNEVSILVVDDNPGDISLLLSAFKEIGFSKTVVTAHDGLEALDYLMCTGSYASRDKSLTPNLVLLDLKMPKVNGFEVLAKMRADRLLRYVPVVVFTSSDDTLDRIQSLDRGANIFVKKPADYEGWLGVARFIDKLFEVMA
jgi:two-component system, response regulator